MNQLSKLHLFFKTHFPSNHEGLEEFLAAFETRQFPKGSILRKARHVEKELRFMEQGFVREYYATPEKEVNIHFFEESQFITDFISLYNASPSQKWQECLSPVIIKTMPKSIFQRMLDKYICGRSIIEALFRKIIQTQDRREFDRITQSPDDLYKNLLESRPNLLLKIPQYHIASYLGVTPETLSRIKKRLA